MHIDNDREEDKIESQTKMIMSLVWYIAENNLLTVTYSNVKDFMS